MQGRLFPFVLLVVVCAAILYKIQRAKAGDIPQIRRIAGLDAMEEAIGRATETGRPVFYTPGRGGLLDNYAAQTLAGLEMLGYVAKMTAKYETNLIVGIGEPNVYPLADEIVRQSYIEAGHPDAYTPEMVRFLSPAQFAYAAASLGIMHREKVAATMLIGAFWAESLLLAEGGSQVGAIQIAGTARMYQIPFFIAACDYCLIGEEMFAGGAYLSKDPVKLGTIAGQDIAKLIALISIAVGVIAVSFGNDFLPKLFTNIK